MAALASGSDDVVRLLLERHRREFPQGAYAGHREELLGRLPPAARRD
ncbi:hypothetical protein WMF30_36560 [Sorangium sp. So ce134]